MIRITIELCSARTGKVTELGRIHLTNQGTGTRTHGNYHVEVFGKPPRQTPIRQAHVHNHPRLARPVFDLLLKALLATGYKP